jgi:hypothetical protein
MQEEEVRNEDKLEQRSLEQLEQRFLKSLEQLEIIIRPYSQKAENGFRALTVGFAELEQRFLNCSIVACRKEGRG